MGRHRLNSGMDGFQFPPTARAYTVDDEVAAPIGVQPHALTAAFCSGTPEEMLTQQKLLEKKSMRMKKSGVWSKVSNANSHASQIDLMKGKSGLSLRRALTSERANIEATAQQQRVPRPTGSPSPEPLHYLGQHTTSAKSLMQMRNGVKPGGVVVESVPGSPVPEQDATAVPVSHFPDATRGRETPAAAQMEERQGQGHVAGRASRASVVVEDLSPPTRSLKTDRPPAAVAVKLDRFFAADYGQQVASPTLETMVRGDVGKESPRRRGTVDSLLIKGITIDACDDSSSASAAWQSPHTPQPLPAAIALKSATRKTPKAGAGTGAHPIPITSPLLTARTDTSTKSCSLPGTPEQPTIENIMQSNGLKNPRKMCVHRIMYKDCLECRPKWLVVKTEEDVPDVVLESNHRLMTVHVNDMRSDKLMSYTVKLEEMKLNSDATFQKLEQCLIARCVPGDCATRLELRIPKRAMTRNGPRCHTYEPDSRVVDFASRECKIVYAIKDSKDVRGCGCVIA